MALQRAVPQPRRRAVQDRRRAQGEFNHYSGHRQGADFPNRSSTASSTHRRRRASSRPPASPSATPNTSTSCRSRTGTATADGRRTSRGSRCRRTTVSTGVSIPDSIRPSAPDSVDRVQYVAGNENFQQGAFLRPGPGDPYIYSFGTPSGRGGAAYISRVLPGRRAGSSQVRVLEFGFELLGARQSRGRDAGDPRAGQRDVGAVQHISEAVLGAVRQRCQRHGR